MANYVNNKKLLNHLIDYKQRKQNDSNATLDDYTARAILEIANNFASRPNFSGYTFKEEMIADAVENVIRYIDNFDPSKSQNPFAYITQICHYAFLRRIKQEKTQTYVRFKSLQQQFHNAQLSEGHATDGKYEGIDYSVNNPMYENMEEFIDEFESEMMENKRKSREYNKKLNRKKDSKKQDDNKLTFE